MLEILGKKKIFKGNYLNVWQTEFKDKKGNIQTWEWIEKNNAVFIFPITKEQKVVLIKNFRVPLERYVIEMPAGLMDRDETSEETARRELLEEVGYLAEKLTPVATFPYRSGASNATAKGFIATGLVKIKDEAGDETEDIEVIEIEREKLIDFYLENSRNVLFNLEIISMNAIATSLKIEG